MAGCVPKDSSRGPSEAEGAAVWADADGMHIDVRGLGPPGPLIAILRFIESESHDGVIIAHLPRDPVHLYPELAERGWSATPLAAEPGEVRIRLHKQEG